jgi:hypothetical protein
MLTLCTLVRLSCIGSTVKVTAGPLLEYPWPSHVLNRRMVTNRTTNLWVQATLDYGFGRFLSRCPSAPEPVRWANRSAHLTATMQYLKGLLAEDCLSSKESGLGPHGAHQQRYAGQAARQPRGYRIIEQNATRHGTGADILEVPRRSSAQPTGSRQRRVSAAVSDRTFVATCA